MNNVRSLVLALICLLAWTATSFALQIHFKAKAVAQGEFITLGEVAEITPVSDTARILKEQTLFRAPAPGDTSLLNAKDIEHAVLENDPALRDVHWGGARRIRVKRAGITIGSKKIVKIIDGYLAAKRAFLPKEAHVHFKAYHLPLPFVLPQGHLTSRVIPANPLIIGSHSFTLIFRIDGRVVKNIAIQGNLSAVAPVVIAAVDIPRGATLTANDLQMAPFDLSKLHGDPCLNLQALVGKRLLRPMQMGQPIDRRALDIPPLVRRGDLVVMQARKGPLLVTATGISRMNGRMGEVIRVQNIASHREIYCKVTGPDKATVEF